MTEEEALLSEEAVNIGKEIDELMVMKCCIKTFGRAKPEPLPPVAKLAEAPLQWGEEAAVAEQQQDQQMLRSDPRLGAAAVAANKK